MYLAKLQTGSEFIYQLRQSYQTHDGTYASRLVFELGNDPNRFIEPFTDHIVLFDENLLDAVSSHGTKDPESVLEQLLYNFLPDETKRCLALFQPRSSRPLGPLTKIHREEISRQVHVFDRRRLYYLRYGAIDQSRLSRLHEKCCRPLLGQSRDEREYYFAAEETSLDPGNYFQYVYAILNLQKYFSQSFAPWLPEALAFDEMAEYVVKELCQLTKDQRFWQHRESTESLHHHLVRYLIMFFDYTPANRSYSEDFSRTFMANHRKFRWPERNQHRDPDKISEIMATPYNKLQQMTREELSRLYRKKAMKLHPDRGGDHDLFIELTDIYKQLLQAK